MSGPIGGIKFLVLVNIGKKMKFYKFNIYWDYIKIGLMAIGVFVGVGIALSIPLCLLWNWLMPHIFGLPTINILEAFGISILVTLLSPKSFKLNGSTSKKIDTSDIDKKLEEVLKNITSHFQA